MTTFQEFLLLAYATALIVLAFTGNIVAFLVLSVVGLIVLLLGACKAAGDADRDAEKLYRKLREHRISRYEVERNE